MSDSFDRYAEWLGVKAPGGHPNYYDLLQIGRLETDPDRIAKAASAQLVKLRAIRPGARLPLWRELMEEIEAAARVLSNPESRKEYDAGPGRVDASMEFQAERIDSRDAEQNQRAGQNILPPGATVRMSPAGIDQNANSTVSGSTNSGAEPSGKPALAPLSPPISKEPAAAKPVFAPALQMNSLPPLRSGPPVAPPPGPSGYPAPFAPQPAAPGPPTGMPQFLRPPMPGGIPSGSAAPFRPGMYPSSMPAAPGLVSPGSMPTGPRPPAPFQYPPQPQFVPPSQYPGHPQTFPQPPYPAQPQQFAPAPAAAAGNFFDDLMTTKSSPLDELGLGGSAEVQAPFPCTAPGSYHGNPAPSYGSPSPNFTPQPQPSPHASYGSTSPTVAMVDDPTAVTGHAYSINMARRPNSGSNQNNSIILGGGIAVAVAAIIGLGVYLMQADKHTDREMLASASEPADNGSRSATHDTKDTIRRQPSSGDQGKPKTPTGSPLDAIKNPAETPAATPNQPQANPPSPNQPNSGSPAATVTPNPTPTTVPPVNTTPPATAPPAAAPPTTPPPTTEPPAVVKPVDPPKTAAPPEQPQPKPTDPAEVAKLKKLLVDVRTKLGERKPDDAKKLLADAGKISANAAELQPLVDHHAALAHYVGEFWGAVHDAVNGLNATDEIDVGSTKVVVVDKSADSITLHIGGQNRKFKIDQLPIGFVVAIASHWLDQKDPRNKLPVGAFWFVEPKGSVAKAKQLWGEASAGGVAEVNALLPLLEGESGGAPAN